jgi:hypothetical protein
MSTGTRKSPPRQDPTGEKKMPVFTWAQLSAGGRVEIAVWDKVVSAADGDRTVYHVTCHRSYRKEDGSYENTGAFWHQDLLVLAHGFHVVYDWIRGAQQAQGHE